MPPRVPFIPLACSTGSRRSAQGANGHAVAAGKGAELERVIARAERHLHPHSRHTLRVPLSILAGFVA